jgi:hypothetical protein
VGRSRSHFRGERGRTCTYIHDHGHAATRRGNTSCGDEHNHHASPAPGSVTNNCVNPVAFVGNVATCTYIINNPSAGLFTVNASASFIIGGVTVTRTTNGAAGNSGPATKRFVDAQIDLTPLTGY